MGRQVGRAGQGGEHVPERLGGGGGSGDVGGVGRGPDKGEAWMVWCAGGGGAVDERGGRGRGEGRGGGRDFGLGGGVFAGWGGAVPGDVEPGGGGGRGLDEWSGNADGCERRHPAAEARFRCRGGGGAAVGVCSPGGCSAVDADPALSEALDCVGRRRRCVNR